MNCSSATAPVAASVPQTAGGHGHAQLAGNSFKTARVTVNGSANWQGASAKPAAATDSDSSEGSETTSGSDGAFAAIIQQLSGAGMPSQATAATQNQGLFPRFQLTRAASTMDESTTETEPADTAGTTRANKKDTASTAPLTASDSEAGSAAIAKDRPPDITAFPIDVVAPPSALKPRLFNYADTGAAQQTQSRSQPEVAAASRPEAALTVVIRTDSSSAQDEPAQQIPAAVSDNGTNPVTAPLAGPSSDAVAPVGEVQALPAVQASAQAVSGPVPEDSAERRKNTTVALTGAADADVANSPGQPTAAFQDFQAKAEPLKTADNAQPRNEPQRAPAAAEPPLADKTPAQPLRSVALEFTPDGARDVRVRLSERAGEVHVTLHSSDPAITKNLRAGVTDLASVLAQAGYDAKTWTSGRQQQENPQQQADTPLPQRRAVNVGSGAESFEGVLQQGALPKISQEIS